MYRWEEDDPNYNKLDNIEEEEEEMDYVPQHPHLQNYFEILEHIYSDEEDVWEDHDFEYAGEEKKDTGVKARIKELETQIKELATNMGPDFAKLIGLLEEYLVTKGGSVTKDLEEVEKEVENDGKADANAKAKSGKKIPNKDGKEKENPPAVPEQANDDAEKKKLEDEANKKKKAGQKKAGNTDQSATKTDTSAVKADKKKAEFSEKMTAFEEKYTAKIKAIEERKYEVFKQDKTSKFFDIVDEKQKLKEDKMDSQRWEEYFNLLETKTEKLNEKDLYQSADKLLKDAQKLRAVIKTKPKKEDLDKLKKEMEEEKKKLEKEYKDLKDDIKKFNDIAENLNKQIKDIEDKEKANIDKIDKLIGKGNEKNSLSDYAKKDRSNQMNGKKTDKQKAKDVKIKQEKAKAKEAKQVKKEIAQAKGDYVNAEKYNKIKPFENSEGAERLEWSKKLSDVKSFDSVINEKNPEMVCGNTDQPCTPGVLLSNDLSIISNKNKKILLKDKYYKKLIDYIKEGHKLPKRLQGLMVGYGIPEKDRTYLDFILQMKGSGNTGKTLKELYESPKKNKDKKPKDIGDDDKKRRSILKKRIMLLLTKLNAAYQRQGGKEDKNNIFHKTKLGTSEIAGKVKEIGERLGVKNKSMDKEDHEYSTDEEF